MIILVAALGIRLFGGSIYETVKRWYVGSVNESIMVNVTKDDLLEIFQKNTSSVSDTDVTQTGAKPQANTLAVTYGKNKEGPVTLSVLLKSPTSLPMGLFHLPLEKEMANFIKDWILLLIQILQLQLP